MSPHRALLVVDVQRAGNPPELFLRKLRAYSARFPCRVFTRFINPADSMFRRLLSQTCCFPGTPDVELLLNPSKGDLVIRKSTYGLTPSHIQRIRARGIKSVTVCGIDTDACVLGVMFSLFDAGIECHLKEQMCWSSSGLHKPALAIIRAQFPEPR